MTRKMVEDKSSSQDTVQKSGHAVLGNVSYDKDVVEIKLADAIDSDNYVGNFVKDVCVDDGALLHRTASEEKPVDRRSSLDLSCQMIGADSDISYYGKEDHSRTSAHELKPEAVALAPLCNIGADSGREYDLEDRTGTGSIAGSPGEKKISLQELLLLESAEESRNTGAVNSESSEKHKCPLNEEEEAAQVYQTYKLFKLLVSLPLPLCCRYIYISTCSSLLTRNLAENSFIKTFFFGCCCSYRLQRTAILTLRLFWPTPLSILVMAYQVRRKAVVAQRRWLETRLIQLRH
jgi:hypothetical protein